jgi:GH15 family glucan-1,4-alpha-glucosidase
MAQPHSSGPSSRSATASLAARSVEVIKAGQAPTGAYLAGPDFPPYRYSWFRDGAFIADAMSRVGETASADAFFDWCSAILGVREELIRSGGRLDCRYTVDGRESEEEWSTYQLDGYGLWLWALREHCGRHGRDPARWQEGIELTVDYLARHWHEPCVDWWEEREGFHPATLACIYAGLRAWRPEGAEALRLTTANALPQARLDASLLVLMTPFEVLDRDDGLLARIEADLVSPTGGVHRHLEDTYYGGGEWLLLTALLGWHYAELGRADDARAALAWVEAHATQDGLLAEQSQDHLLEPELYEPWVERWGDPACPLLWSHAMYLTLADALRLI